LSRSSHLRRLLGPASGRSGAESIDGGSAITGTESSTEPRRSTGGTVQDSDTSLAMMAEKYKNAVGVVVLVGNDGPVPYATAWSISPSWFATNSHVTELVKKAQKHGVDVFIAINRSPDKRYRVVKAVSHPRYNETKRNFEGKSSMGGFDVGLLKIEGRAPKQFPLADVSELKKIASGYRIAYLGFPIENLAGGNIDIHSPLATMQSGIITTISDYWLGEGGFEKNFLLRHNLGATGGASGSPLFNTRGEVVGILDGGNAAKMIVVNDEGKPIGIKSVSDAAMINTAQRVDLLNDILP
jgi:V8-like Glu-specific endopeptidase